MALLDRIRIRSLVVVAAIAAMTATGCTTTSATTSAHAGRGPTVAAAPVGSLRNDRRPRPPTDGSRAIVYRRGRYQPLGAIPGATFGSLHLDINNRGEIVGTSLEAGPSGTPADGTTHGFVQDRRGHATVLDVPGAAATTAWGNNDRGQTVGFSLDPGTVPAPDGSYPTDDAHVFVRDRRGRITPMDLALPNLRGLGDINDRGQIVGTYVDADGAYRGFRREPNGRITPIDVPGAGTFAFGLDDRGRVAGYYGDPGTTPNPDGSFPPHRIHGFVWDHGQVTTLDVPGSQATYAFRMNDRGQITGGYHDTAGIQHGFVYQRGRYQTLTPPSRADSTALGINDHGEILIPEPTTRLFTISTE